ncbi:MAG TPA: hypothetical protein VET48_09210, partial [Steroidobacteraceae bacterium]|nr:hypothetical protein [Steroidobacteraceae bacterium]
MTGLDVTSVSVADANFVLPNPNMGEAGIWFAFQNDPTHAFASLTFDSSTADLGGTMYGRAEIYRFRPMGVEAARLTL